jgi:carbonic anhydrase
MRERGSRSRRFLWIAGVFAGLGTALVAPGVAWGQGHGDHGDAGWGYDCAAGPPFLWGESFPTCGEGREQSPIDVSTTGSVRADLPALEPRYGTADLTVENNGHTVEAHVPEGAATLKVGGQTYRLIRFHWHTPSEHWVDGESFPMELHMVHGGDAGNLVLGALIEAGAPNGELEKIWSKLPTKPGPPVKVPAFDLAKLLPGEPGSKLTSYRYPGSLTTPDCGERISWVLLARPATLSAEQIGAFRAIFFGTDGFPVGNARPVQPRNGRTVRTDTGGY